MKMCIVILANPFENTGGPPSCRDDEHIGAGGRDRAASSWDDFANTSEMDQQPIYARSVPNAAGRRWLILKTLFRNSLSQETGWADWPDARGLADLCKNLQEIGGGRGHSTCKNLQSGRLLQAASCPAPRPGIERQG
jgi:hypothetical protein